MFTRQYEIVDRQAIQRCRSQLVTPEFPPVQPRENNGLGGHNGKSIALKKVQNW
ncbi:hypothetical protein X757_03215 [Mesorhizobium sp. LSHC414A00]|nr:hypothetical protein X757_03215 [Mesorhizobium sp. LSHC414A00]